MEIKKKYLDYDAALKKMQNFCAYQERAHSEVQSKLLDLGVYGDNVGQIIAELIQDNYLNEERFAKVYAHGKNSIKKWGKIRIKQELKLRKVSDYCIRKGMEEILDEEYWANLLEILSKKKQLLNETDAFKANQKLFQYAMQKGYEIELIQAALKEI